MLSHDQKRSFKRDGFLTIEGGVNDDIVAKARSAVWESVPEDPDEPDSLVGVGNRNANPADEAPFEEINRRLYEFARELVGDTLIAPDDGSIQLPLRYPGNHRLSDHHARTPAFGHLDGYGSGYKTHGEYTGFTIGANVYLDRVEPRGGGFTVWPGSHWIAANYFSTHSLSSPGYHGRLPAIDDDGEWDYTTSFTDQSRSTELTGDAGTVILWHNKLLHSGGANQSDRVRMAAINRFSRDNHEDIKADAADKPFKYWDGMGGI